MIAAFHDVYRRYGKHSALKGLNLSVPEGSAFALVGANGAGKTTAIKILMNLIAPTGGHANVLGIDSRALSPREFARIGYVSENQSLPERLTVGEYLNYLRPFYPTWDRDRESQLLRQLRLPLDRKIGALSHGMHMKMLLLCALPFRPALLVLDEPFSGLDPLVRDELLEGLIEGAGSMTVLISSHDLAEIEGFITHLAFVDSGRVLFQEGIDDLSARHREVRVTLDQEPPSSVALPDTWLDVRRSGSVLSFIDTQYTEAELPHRIAAQFSGIRDISIESVSLRRTFTTLARAAQTQASSP
jgi:ABC-2 type transport system ATP-binding protein